MYEAGANVMWLSVGLTDENEIPVHDAPWQTVLALAMLFAGPLTDEGVSSSSTAADGGASPNKAASLAKARLIFPCPLEGCADAASDLERDFFNGTIRLLGGHALLHAWYLKTYLAMQSHDGRQLRLLWQAALTASLKVTVISDLGELMAASMAFSEKIKAEEKHLTDTFPVFITKLQRLLAARGVPFNGSQQAVSAAASLGARFNGSLINRAMMQAAASIHGVMKEAATAVLNGIEAEFGRDVFSSSYNKLHRMATVVRQANLVPTQSEAADAFLFSWRERSWQ
jgi:hypothetical protein